MRNRCSAAGRSWAQLTMSVGISAVAAGLIFGTFPVVFDGAPFTLVGILRQGAGFAVTMGIVYFVLAAREKRRNA